MAEAGPVAGTLCLQPKATAMFTVAHSRIASRFELCHSTTFRSSKTFPLFQRPFGHLTEFGGPRRLWKRRGRCYVCVASLDVAMEWVAHLFRICEVPGSNLGPQTGCPDRGFCGFPQALRDNASIVGLLQIMLRSLPTLIPIHYPLISLLYDAAS
jgi:hypothetical protein